EIIFTAPKGNTFYKISFYNPASWMYVQGPNRPFAFTDNLATGVLSKYITLWMYIPQKYIVEILFKELTRNVYISRDGVDIDKFFIKNPDIYKLSDSGIFSI